MRVDRIHAGIVALLLFALYAASSPRSVALEDDAFFILSSYFMGVAHPPGYPLHSMLGKLFTFLPFGSVAYRVHLLSAAFGAATCAVLWLCARSISGSRLAAHLAAFALGVSPVFWSQSIIAEVYTLNSFFFFLLLYLALRGGSLAAMALLFGLSLSNHWPLMLLAAPALAVLLWPRISEVASRLPWLVLLVIAGLLPYAWMVWRSWYSPIAFYGPIEFLHELWIYVSRHGYAQTDVSPTAGWADRMNFLAFFGRELLLQFALVGTAVAIAGFMVQWREAGKRIPTALTLGFLAPSVVLLLLLGFDYDPLHKHIFHVYPIPAYGIAALWLAHGFAWLSRRRTWGPRASAAAATGLVALTFAVSSPWNLRMDYDWTERYAGAVLRSLPPGASLVLFADSDLGPISYYHLVENRRPDVTLYQSQGLILGNRLFHPMRSPGSEGMRAEWKAFVERESGPLAFIQSPPDGYAQRHHGLFVSLDRTVSDSRAVTVDLPPDVRRFLAESVLARPEIDAWTRLVQGQLRERFGGVLAMSLNPARAPDAETAGLLDAISADFAGSLGIAEGLLANKQGYSIRQVARYLEKARDLMPADVSKERRARFFELRAYLRLEQGDSRGAREDLESALAIWPSQANRASRALKDLRLRQ